jgi:hypothetical protein
MPYAGLAISADAGRLEVNVPRRLRAHYFPKRGKQVVNLDENFNLFDAFGFLCAADVPPAGSIFPLSYPASQLFGPLRCARNGGMVAVEIVKVPAARN